MPAEYYCLISGEQHGPFSAQSLRQMTVAGKLAPTDSVRKDTGRWVLASSVKNLFSNESDKLAKNKVLRKDLMKLTITNYIRRLFTIKNVAIASAPILFLFVLVTVAYSLKLSSDQRQVELKQYTHNYIDRQLRVQEQEKREREDAIEKQKRLDEDIKEKWRKEDEKKRKNKQEFSDQIARLLHDDVTRFIHSGIENPKSVPKNLVIIGKVMVVRINIINHDKENLFEKYEYFESIFEKDFITSNIKDASTIICVIERKGNVRQYGDPFERELYGTTNKRWAYATQIIQDIVIYTPGDNARNWKFTFIKELPEAIQSVNGGSENIEVEFKEIKRFILQIPKTNP